MEPDLKAKPDSKEIVVFELVSKKDGVEACAPSGLLQAQHT